MRIICFFDLPTETVDDRRTYRRFRKMLINNGFIMMQESVYSKLLLNHSGEKTVIEMIRRNKPKSGLVQLLSVTEKQFSKMEFITGEYYTDVLNTDERMVVI